MEEGSHQASACRTRSGGLESPDSRSCVIDDLSMALVECLVSCRTVYGDGRGHCDREFAATMKAMVKLQEASLTHQCPEL